MFFKNHRILKNENFLIFFIFDCDMWTIIVAQSTHFKQHMSLFHGEKPIVTFEQISFLSIMLI